MTSSTRFLTVLAAMVFIAAWDRTPTLVSAAADDRAVRFDLQASGFGLAAGSTRLATRRVIHWSYCSIPIRPTYGVPATGA